MPCVDGPLRSDHVRVDECTAFRAIGQDAIVFAEPESTSRFPRWCRQFLCEAGDFGMWNVNGEQSAGR